MCGRFSLTANNDELRARFGVSVLHNLSPRWTLAPAQSSLVIRAQGLALSTEMAEFGRPSGPDEKRLINARSETVRQKPTFRELFVESRCIVVASGWFEWAKPGKPYHVQLNDGRVMAMAGLYFSGQAKQQGQFVIMTTQADGRLREIHHRCPLILPQSRWMDWLNGTPDQAESCLKPASERYFNAYPVSPEVGNVKNDNAQLVAPYSEPEQHENIGQRDLFS